ncbi:MAG: prepilin-type N-terminal cleavage/methylation domain-containing protein [Clostridia bacterium]
MNKKGFTLIEMVLSSAIFALLFLLLGQLLYFTSQNYQRQQEQAELLQKSGYLMERLCLELDQAKDVHVSKNEIHISRSGLKEKIFYLVLEPSIRESYTIAEDNKTLPLVSGIKSLVIEKLGEKAGVVNITIELFFRKDEIYTLKTVVWMKNGT